MEATCNRISKRIPVQAHPDTSQTSLINKMWRYTFQKKKSDDVRLSQFVLLHTISSSQLLLYVDYGLLLHTNII